MIRTRVQRKLAIIVTTTARDRVARNHTQILDSNQRLLPDSIELISGPGDVQSALRQFHNDEVMLALDKKATDNDFRRPD